MIQEAKKAFAKADHLIYMTYPNIKEVKLLYSAVESLNSAMQKALESLLIHEQTHKRISQVPKDLNSKLLIYNNYCKKHGFPQEAAFLIRELAKIVKARKEAPMEFVRKNKFVICSDDYRMKVIDEKTIKKYLILSRSFITKVEKHING
jgi:hypothetical protein